MKYVRRALFTVAILAGMLALISSDAATVTQSTQYFFTAGASYPSGLGPDGVAVGDLNGDGIDDVVSADSGTNTLSVFLGKSNGTFQPRTIVTTGQNPSDVKLVDVDGDGKLDAIVTNNDDNTLMIFWGDGSGTFSSSNRTILTTGNGPHRIVTGDLDNDGKTDIAVVNWTGTSITIFYNNGNRQFTTQTLGSWGASDSLALGDLNGDGRPDIVIGGERETVYINQGNRVFKSVGNFQPGFHSDSVAVVNFSGKVGVVGASQHEDVLTILYANSDGSLDDNAFDIVTYGLSGSASDMLITDLNGDGIPDTIVTYGSAASGSGSMSVFLGTADGHFLARVDSTLSIAPTRFVKAALNKSGNTDLVGVSSSLSAVTLYFGSPGLDLGNAVTYAVGASPTGIAVGDVNGDGNPDLVTANSVDNTISVLLGSPNGTFGSRADFSVGTSPRRVKLADLNGDGRLDAVTVNSGSGSVTVLTGTGTGVFGAQATYAAGSAPTDITLAGLHGLSVPDIAVADPASGNVVTLLNNGSGVFTPGSTIPVSGTPFAIASGVLRPGSGIQDLVVSQFNSNEIAILTNDGAGNFTQTAEYTVGTNPDAIVIGDFNGDGFPDIAVANFGSNTVTVLLNDGTGNFPTINTATVAGIANTSANQVTNVQPIAITAADMTNEGVLDLITTNSQGSISVLFGDGEGGFPSQSTIADANGPAQTAAADLNGDGRTDLVTVDRTTLSSLVSVRLTSANNAPIAVDLSLALDVHSNSFLTSTLSATSSSGDPLTFVLLSQPAHGKVVLTDASSGTFTYTPDTGFAEWDTFSYEVTDGSLVSNQATVKVQVSNSGSGAFNWLLVALLGAFLGYRTFAPRRTPDLAA